MIYARLGGLKPYTAYSTARVEILISELEGEWRVISHFVMFLHSNSPHPHPNQKRRNPLPLMFNAGVGGGGGGVMPLHLIIMT